MIELNNETFDDAVLEGYSIIDFYADWCSPCKNMSKTLIKLEELVIENKVKFFKVNVDTCDKADQFNVESYPTVVLLKDGIEVNRLIGYRPPKTTGSIITEWITNV